MYAKSLTARHRAEYRRRQQEQHQSSSSNGDDLLQNGNGDAVAYVRKAVALVNAAARRGWLSTQQESRLFLLFSEKSNVFSVY